MVVWATGEEIIAGINRFTNITRCIILAHGGPTILFWKRPQGSGQGGIKSNLMRNQAGFITVSAFAEALGPRMGPNCVIGLAACKAGMGAAENTEWNNRYPGRRGPPAEDAQARFQYLHGETGQDSIAAKIRDALKRYRSDFEVRAHRTTGEAVQNPYCITFYGGHPVGSVVRSLAVSVYGPPPSTGLQTWLSRHYDEWHGDRARQWILGGIPTPGEGGGRAAYESSFQIGAAPGTLSNGTFAPCVGNPYDISHNPLDRYNTGGTTNISGADIELDQYQIPNRTEMFNRLRGWARTRLGEF
jgi:hypothetical protein